MVKQKTTTFKYSIADPPFSFPIIPTELAPPDTQRIQDMRRFLSMPIESGIKRIKKIANAHLDRILSEKASKLAKMYRLYSFLWESINECGMIITDEWMRPRYNDDWRLVGPIVCMGEGISRLISSENYEAVKMWPRLGGAVICLDYVAETAREIVYEFALDIVTDAGRAMEEIESGDGPCSIREWTARITQMAKDWTFKEVNPRMFRRELDVLEIRLKDEYQTALQLNSRKDPKLSGPLAIRIDWNRSTIQVGGCSARFPDQPWLLMIYLISRSKIGHKVPRHETIDGKQYDFKTLKDWIRKTFDKHIAGMVIETKNDMYCLGPDVRIIGDLAYSRKFKTGSIADHRAMRQKEFINDEDQIANYPDPSFDIDSDNSD